MQRLALFGVFFCLSLSAQAETIDARIAKLDPCGQYVVAHINGIVTDRDGALANLQEISDAYGNGHDGHIIRYRLAYNRTLGFAQDVMDSYRQIARLYPALTLRDWIQGIVFGIFSSAWLPDIIEGVSQALRSIFRLEEPLLFYEQDLQQIVRDMGLVTDERLLIVGHSQGTLYAQMVYERLDERLYPINRNFGLEPSSARANRHRCRGSRNATVTTRSASDVIQRLRSRWRALCVSRHCRPEPEIGPLGRRSIGSQLPRCLHGAIDFA